MFDPLSAEIPPAALATGDLREYVGRLSEVEPAHDGAECVDQLHALERIKSAAAAAQAQIAGHLDAIQTARDEARHLLDGGGSGPRSGSDAGLGSQIGLARQESPHQGRGHLHLARALLGDLPGTLAALTRGDISERRAQIVTTETRDLSRADRMAVDAEIADLFPGLGEVKLTQALRRIVLRLDPDGVADRQAKARARRHLSSRVFGDGTAQISAIINDHHLTSIMDSLGQQADLERASYPEDERTRTQRIADAFVERLTGSTLATGAPVAVKVVISAEALLGQDTTPAEIPGFGPIPSSLAGDLIRAGAGHALSSLQRLFGCPETGALIAAERTTRGFPADLAEAIRIRDQLCRTPWCNAPIRHIDHAQPVSTGGPTSLTNGQGLCEACNYAKEAFGWRQRSSSGPDEPHQIEIRTPTGQLHHSREPGLPRRGRETGAEPLPRPTGPVEISFADLILTA